jgi:hypothetical protein
MRKVEREPGGSLPPPAFGLSHERKRAGGHQRHSFYLTQHDLECLNCLARQFGWSRSTVVGRALEAVWKHVSANKGG